MLQRHVSYCSLSYSANVVIDMPPAALPAGAAAVQCDSDTPRVSASCHYERLNSRKKAGGFAANINITTKQTMKQLIN